MKDRVCFYSSRDLSIPSNLQRADAVIEKYKDGWRPEDVNDVVELYCIWKIVDNGIYKSEWPEEVLQLIKSDIKNEVVGCFRNLKRDTWVSVYQQLEFRYKAFFWEILANFNFDGILDKETIHQAIPDSDWRLQDILRQERLVRRHEPALVDLLRKNEHSAEWLLKEYVEYDTFDGENRMYFPRLLSLQDKEDIISRYLDTEEPNLNYVRLIREARKDNNLKLSDLIKLKASKVEERLNENYFRPENTKWHKFAICIKNNPEKQWRWMETDANGVVMNCYSKDWLLRFKGYALMHYLRYCFEFLTLNGMISLVAKDSDSSAFERRITMRGKCSYPINLAFHLDEAISSLQMVAIQKVLTVEGTNLELSVKEFYEKYLKEQYGYPSGVLSLADASADWVVKCKAIAPEIDAIAHRYDLYARTGAVDEDLLKFSTDNVRITEAQSANQSRYYTINGEPEELNRLFFLFFSEQSMLANVKPFKSNRYHSFYQLLVEQDGKISYENYENFQMKDIDYLIEAGYLCKGEDGMLTVEKFKEISLLKELYEYHSVPSRSNDAFENLLLQEMTQKGWLQIDNHLLSKSERDYFDYYLYNRQYTNGPALRNRYLHGSHDDPTSERVHQENYNRLLILLALELLKIEEDLIAQQFANEAGKD